MKTILTFVLFICLISSLSYSTSKAQCPTTIHPTATEPHYVPWIYDSLEVQDPIDQSCHYMVYYCHRFIDSFPCNPPPPPDDSFACTTIQRFVDSVVLIKNPGVPAVNPCGGTVSMISSAIEKVWNLPPDTTLPPCGAISVPTLEMYTNACWMFHDHYPAQPPDTVNNLPSRPEKWVFTPCNMVDSSQMCVMRCKLCQDGDEIMRFDCSYSNTGTPTCKILGYDPRNPPFPDMPVECFVVPCGEHP